MGQWEGGLDGKALRGSGKKDSGKFCGTAERAAMLSEKEIQFSGEAIGNTKTSRAHFSGPRASFRYRCPVCREIIIRGGPPQNIRTHFPTLRSNQEEEYHIAVNRRDDTQIVRKGKATGEIRDGAGSPYMGVIRKHWEGEENDSQLGELKEHPSQRASRGKLARKK